ncbi:uncharacterized protein LOC100906666 [Galendromus occidentalis]|uniref:Uncharacterized protein LOC100906666 n=1 Tax=Galendromus occidentalis TaxID=34638 RepID=A0AAJ6VZU8_9ACAR|nr:uncharacterized protein LOC100906666 [Galendromus occidentalis]
MVTSNESSVANQTPGVTGVSALSARWAKLRADPALQRSAALRARLARRERRNRQRILRLQEFHRLRSMVPTIAQTPNVDKVTVIEEAIKYIDHLHEALRNKFTERGLPPSLQGMPIDLETTDMRDVVRLLANNTEIRSTGRPLSLPPPADSIPHPCERQRNVPSYLLKAKSLRKQDR